MAAKCGVKIKSTEWKYCDLLFFSDYRDLIGLKSVYRYHLGVLVALCRQRLYSPLDDLGQNLLNMDMALSDG